MTASIDCFDDLQIDHTVMEEADLGFRFDRRSITRISAPQLWSSDEIQDGQSASVVLPDCSALVRRAARAKEAGDEAKYEIYMQQLVRFFGNYAPARTPGQVRRAFRLGAPSNKDVDNQRAIEKQMPFLDADTTRRICTAPIDVSRIDALQQADQERDKCAAKKNK